MTLRDEGYTTPEGHWLPRELLMPDARSFDDVLEYIGPWPTGTNTTPAGGRTLAPHNVVGPYTTFRGWPDYRKSIVARATDATMAALNDSGGVVTDDDRLHFEVILHPDRDRALVVLSHGYIIGSRWLAYIDAATIPAEED